jgi:hypothetical protein
MSTFQAATSFQLEQSIRLPESCPGCTQRLLDADFRPDQRALADFVTALKAALRLQNERRTVTGTIQLEFVFDRASLS